MQCCRLEQIDANKPMRGFTLIELLVVLAIGAFIAALVVPRFTGAMERAAVRSSAIELEAALRATRSLAMRGAHTQALIVNTVSGAFQQGATIRQLPKGIHLAVITTTGDRLNVQTGRIRFFPDGTSTGGGVDIWAGKSRSQVLVDWLSGRVSIEERSHGLTR